MSSRSHHSPVSPRAILSRAKTPAMLVTHLSHPNGWWRDTAQRLLVLKQDKSVVPALKAIVKSSHNLLAHEHRIESAQTFKRPHRVKPREQIP